ESQRRVVFDKADPGVDKMESADDNAIALYGHNGMAHFAVKDGFAAAEYCQRAVHDQVVLAIGPGCDHDRVAGCCSAEYRSNRDRLVACTDDNCLCLQPGGVEQ